MNDPFVFAPAAFYLLTVTFALLTLRRCPSWVHGLFLAIGLPFRLWNEGVVGTVVSAAASLGVFVVLLLVGSRLLSKVGLLSIVTSLALLPMVGWPSIGGGLLLAALVGAVRTARVLGSSRVNMLATETFAAMGVGLAGFQRPDMERLPTREDTDLMAGDAETASRLRLYLPPYLLAGVLVSAGLSLLLALR